MAAEAGLVDVVAEDGRWDAAAVAAAAERAARAALIGAGLPAEGYEISLLLCDDMRIAALNRSFRGRPGPTNVLSWPALAPAAPAEMPAPPAGDRVPAPPAGYRVPAPPAGYRVPAPPAGGEPLLLGDIALAYETCAREAGAAGLPLGDHVTHLVVHGVLHLLGYDHEEAEAAEAMEALEGKVLATLGVADPYTR